MGSKYISCPVCCCSAQLMHWKQPLTILLGACRKYSLSCSSLEGVTFLDVALVLYGVFQRGFSLFLLFG